MGRDTVSKPCIHAEDPVHARRPAPNPGPRCATCWRRVKRERRTKARANRVETTYGITGEEYEALRQDQHGLAKNLGNSQRSLLRKNKGKRLSLSGNGRSILLGSNATGLVQTLPCLKQLH